MSEKRKSCPFCGGVATFTSMSTDGKGWVLGCTDSACRVVPNTWGSTEAEAIAAWNTRAAPRAETEKETT